MAPEGQGSAKIVLVARRAPGQDPAASAARAAPPRPARERDEPRPTGWTMRRLMIGASLGGISTIAGAVLFADNFTLLTGSRGPLLAAGFALFVVGMIGFSACLIGLAGHAVAALVRERGWALTALGAVALTAPVFGLWAAGVFGFAIPALLAVLVAGGFAVALNTLR